MPWRKHPVTATIRALAAAVDAKGHYVPGHSDGVAYIIGTMAAEVGATTEEVRDLELAALLHDVGKLHIPDHILNAQRPLTADEFAVIKEHPRWSAHIVKMLDGMDFAVPWVMHHHEHFDGGGYPYGLVGEDIPWPSRMLAAADAYHVMTTDRPYQAARSRLSAINTLRSLSGTQFDPKAVELLLAHTNHTL